MEEQIVEKLKQNIPEPGTTDPIVKVQEDQSQARTAIVYPLDETIQYKLHKFLGEDYSPINLESQKQIQFIYERTAHSIGNVDYSLVIAEINNLEGRLGSRNEVNRIYTLYQWLKLDSIRQNIDVEMGSLIHA